jgi:putative endonuclease
MDLYVYMLRCGDNSYYVGVTRTGLDKRLGEHASGTYRGCYTFRRRPVKLVWSQHFLSIRDAIACERRIKARRRAKKEALIRGDFAALSELSKTARTHSEAGTTFVHPSTGSG